MRTLRLFLARHMKVKEPDVRVGQHLNELIWQHGIKNPPCRVTINVTKGDDGIAYAELAGKEYKGAVKPKARKEEAGGLREKLQATLAGKKGDDATDESKNDKKDAKDDKKAADDAAAKKAKKAQPDIRKAPQPKSAKPVENPHEQ
jgi:hypothetical protein